VIVGVILLAGVAVGVTLLAGVAVGVTLPAGVAVWLGVGELVTVPAAGVDVALGVNVALGVGVAGEVGELVATTVGVLVGAAFMPKEARLPMVVKSVPSW